MYVAVFRGRKCRSAWFEALAVGTLARPPQDRTELRLDEEGGKGTQARAEETGVNRIFTAGHSCTPSASAPYAAPSASNHSPSPPGQQGPRLGVQSHKCWSRARQVGRGVPTAPHHLVPHVWEEAATQSGSVPINAPSVWPGSYVRGPAPPLLSFSSQRAARRVTQPAGALAKPPRAWPHAHHPGQNRAGLGGALCAQSLGRWGYKVLDKNHSRGDPDSLRATRHPPEVSATCLGPKMGQDVPCRGWIPASPHPRSSAQVTGITGVLSPITLQTQVLGPESRHRGGTHGDTVLAFPAFLPANSQRLPTAAAGDSWLPQSLSTTTPGQPG